MVHSHEHAGLSLEPALRAIALELTSNYFLRSEAARLLALADETAIVDELLRQFFSREAKEGLWWTALTLETLGSPRAVGPLIAALSDANPDRRRAAARALGWIPRPGKRAVDALIVVLTDTLQPAAVREEAAESLAYLHSSRAIPPLISVLADPGAGVRFWSAFALGSLADPRAIPALESMLPDDAAPPGWWSIGREALAMLGHEEPPVGQYRQQLAEEVQRVKAAPNASPEDRRWAESYSS
jgi:HEAT repeat protein